MAKNKGMSGSVPEGGHWEPSKAPALKKGEFAGVGTFIDEGAMTTVEPKGIGVNQKTGKTQVGSAEF